MCQISKYDLGDMAVIYMSLKSITFNLGEVFILALVLGHVGSCKITRFHK
jgi:hypothetical protein